ncbi:MAG: hypothetical protein IK048_05185 [Clostridia bacterium]|nr:hypothetical protein [Clostridia bacterium]
MKEVIFDRNNYTSYKDFYAQIYKDLDGKHTIDWEQYDNLCYSADGLNEFLWYKAEENIHYIFKNFDKERIAKQSAYDDYEYNLIVEVFEYFAKQFPNNKVEFMPVEK